MSIGGQAKHNVQLCKSCVKLIHAKSVSLLQHVLHLCRDEDHLALFIELLGRMPRRLSGTGKYAKDYFNRHGELRHIKKMRFWPLDKVLSEKYHLPVDEVQPC